MKHESATVRRRPRDFLAEQPVFTHEEFLAAHRAGQRRSPHTADNLLAKYVASGRLLRVRRGLYAVLPATQTPDAAAVDPYLVATKLAPDAVVAYHAALQFHGRAYSVWTRFPYLVRERARPLVYRGSTFVPVQAPLTVRSRTDLGGGVLTRRHAGGLVRVASLERTLVDVLDQPEHAGGWEEVWRSLEMVEFFDLDAVVEYALRLRSALTVARVGFYLEQHQAELMVDDRYLGELRRRVPTQASYFDRRREPGRLAKTWNLIIPGRVLERSWASVA